MFSLSEFEKSLAFGTGRAALMIQEFWQNHAVEMRPALLYAVQNDLRYERQANDLHALYLFDLISLTPECSEFLQCTLRALEAVNDDNFYQLMELTRRFAQAGYDEAHLALYTAFEEDAVKGDKLDSGDDIVMLDGADGLLWIAERYHDRLFCDDPKDYSAFDSLIRELEKRDGEVEAWQNLEAKCADNPVHAEWFAEWKRYTEERDKRWAENRKKPRPRFTYAEVRTDIEERGRKAGFGRSWSRTAKPDELERAAHDLLAETDPKRIIPMLKIFAASVFPLDPAPLIRWAQSEEDYVYWFAQVALGNITHPDVRRFALKTLKSNQDTRKNSAVDMLSKNYVAGDEALVLHALNAPFPNEEFRHNLCSDASHFEEAHPSELSVPILTKLYEEMNCGLCRHGVVERLNELKAIPDGIRAEIPYDSDDATRKFALLPNTLL